MVVLCVAYDSQARDSSTCGYDWPRSVGRARLPMSPKKSDDRSPEEWARVEKLNAELTAHIVGDNVDMLKPEVSAYPICVFVCVRLFVC